MPKTKIKKFGFEIEGEFSSNALNILQDFGRIGHDGTVRKCSPQRAAKYHSHSAQLRTHEFVTEPLLYTKKGRKEAMKIFTELNDLYKEGEYHWNKSAGFHVHLSFKPKMPVEIWSAEFVKYFYETLEQKHKQAYKGRSECTYSKAEKREEDILTNRSRYKGVNLHSAYAKHGTIEFRIFPAKAPMVMHKYLTFVFNTVDYFIENAHLFLNRRFELELDKDPEEEVKEYEISAIANDKSNEDEVNNNEGVPEGFNHYSTRGFRRRFYDPVARAQRRIRRERINLDEMPF